LTGAARHQSIFAGLGLAAALAMATAAGGQAVPGGNPVVAWTVGTPAQADARGRAVLQVKGTIQPGWHVYALKQTRQGPLPLKAAVEAGPAIVADGVARSSAPVAAFDPAFGFTTPFHVDTLDLALPVRVLAAAGPGRHAVTLAVRYQSCNGSICQPPRTVRLEAAVDAHGR
jgi:hypothetical protein